MHERQAIHIDHINIRTDRFDESCDFYQRLLLLNRSAPPGLDPARFAWLSNDKDQPIIHIASLAEDEPGEEATTVSRGTGRLHHIAFTCADYAAWRSRIDAMALDCEENEFPAARLRQLFVLDPDGIRLEFNFYAVDEEPPVA